MRYTRRVSVWPVAFVGGLRYESPKVSPAGKVVGWKTVFDPNRPFAIDMAGFAISIKLILEKPQASFKLEGVKGGYQETSLLKDLVTMDGLEPKAANCTKVSRIRDLENVSPFLDPGGSHGLLPCPIHLSLCLLCASTPQLRTVPDRHGLPNAMQMRGYVSAEEQLKPCTLIKNLFHAIRAQIFSLKLRTGRGLIGVLVQNALFPLSVSHIPVKTPPGPVLIPALTHQSPEQFLVLFRCWFGTQELRGPLWLMKASADLQTPGWRCKQRDSSPV